MYHWHWVRDWGESMCVSVILFFSLVPRVERVKAVWDRFDFWSLSQRDYIKQLGAFHNLVRLTNTAPDGPLVGDDKLHWQYWALLTARGDFKWEPLNDLAMRLRPGNRKLFPTMTERGVVFSASAWDREVRVELLEVLRKGSEKLRNVQTLDDVWNKRLLWVAAGSAPGFKQSLDLDGTAETIRPNKRLAQESISLEDLRYLVNCTHPILLSRMVKKYELSKNRVLWNSQVGHYLMGCLVLEPYEKGLQVIPEIDSYDGATARLQDHVYLTNHTAISDFAYDFSDFNLLHDLDLQQDMWRMIGDLYREYGWDDFFSSCADWLGDASVNTWLEAEGEAGLSARGMLTGVRGTAFMNTLFNVVYMRVARKAYKFLVGTDPVTWMRCRGDDSVAEMTSEADGMAMTKLLVAMGLAGQQIKILTETGRKEYLRIDYREGRARQFLVRTIPNIVNGEYFGPGVVDPVERARAVFAQGEVLRGRGAVSENISPLIDLLLNSVVYLKVQRDGQWWKLTPTRDYYRVSVLGGGPGLVGSQPVFKQLSTHAQPRVNLLTTDEAKSLIGDQTGSYLSRVAASGLVLNDSFIRSHMSGLLSGSLPAQRNAKVKRVLGSAWCDYLMTLKDAPLDVAYDEVAIGHALQDIISLRSGEVPAALPPTYGQLVVNTPLLLMSGIAAAMGSGGAGYDNTMRYLAAHDQDVSPLSNSVVRPKRLKHELLLEKVPFDQVFEDVTALPWSSFVRARALHLAHSSSYLYSSDYSKSLYNLQLFVLTYELQMLHHIKKTGYTE
uniref:RNA-directed RNA polymerase n=1 Tax=Conidiobolus taihushanensis totivirus 1 TaxID=3229900 RepID=A0AAU7YT98_9VIRU